MKKIIFSLFVLALGITAVNAQNVNKQYYPQPVTDNRNEIAIPPVDGYQVLKCDFHMHSVFSDGYVWPSYRVGEAWLDGLDVIAMTDHIEYLPFRDYFKADLNTSYKIAAQAAEQVGLMVIHGTEITRKQGEIGHFNALFIQDANLVPDPDPEIAIQNALKQDAFILFNHPGWLMDTIVWTPFQRKLADKGMIHGIEVFNSREYYPRVLSWCMDGGYTVFSNSDVHGVISEIYTTLRPMTLVFVKEKTQEAVKEALFHGLTLGFFDNKFVGKEELLSALFNACVHFTLHSKNGEKEVYTANNNSSFPFSFCIQGITYNIEPFSSIRNINVTEEDNRASVVNMWCYEDRHPSVTVR